MRGMAKWLIVRSAEFEARQERGIWLEANIRHETLDLFMYIHRIPFADRESPLALFGYRAPRLTLCLDPHSQD